MKRLKFIPIVFLFSFFSCSENKPDEKTKEIRKYYLFVKNGRFPSDTLKYKYVHVIPDSLNIIDSIEINYQKRLTVIKKITNLPNANVDSEFISYWEPAAGIFYTRSLSWKNFVILQTDNDSVNKYIMGLIGNLLLYKSLYSNPEIQNLKPNPTNLKKVKNSHH
jgi:hypothetical protein